MYFVLLFRSTMDFNCNIPFGNEYFLINSTSNPGLKLYCTKQQGEGFVV